MNNIELGTLVGGALQEKFSKSFKKVIENLQDQNTSFKTKRVINIKLVFEQNEQRDDLQVDIDVTEKLAPQTGMHASFCIGKDLKTGNVYAEEYGKQLNGQLKIPEVQPEKEYGSINVDLSTGEVIEDIDENVIDFRKVN